MTCNRCNDVHEAQKKGITQKRCECNCHCTNIGGTISFDTTTSTNFYDLTTNTCASTSDAGYIPDSHDN